MCLIAFNWKNHPKYKLILVANRDEFYTRPSKAIAFWEDKPKIAAGRDLEGGGTWLGVHKSGRFTALTNYRDLKNLKQNPPSRGKLTTQYLEQDIPPEIYLKQIFSGATAYNGFNLLLGNAEELYYFSNYESQIRALDSGLYGLSNALLDSDWYKVKRLKDKLSEAIAEDKISDKVLFDLLQDTSTPEDDSKIQQTGLPIEKERMLASMFIKSSNYGTRCSTLLFLDYENNIRLSERVYKVQNKISKQDYSEKTITFKTDN